MPRDIDFMILLRRKRLLLVSGLLTACLTFAISKMLPLRYAGEGVMVVDAGATQAATAAQGEASALVQTQLDVLQSKGLLTGVVGRRAPAAALISPAPGNRTSSKGLSKIGSRISAQC